jgi:hypothetical protein
MKETFLELEFCPHCNINMPLLQKLTDYDTNSSKSDNLRFWTVYLCKRCGGLITASWSSKNGHRTVYPKPVSIDVAIPDRARAYLQEAVNSKHSPSACIMVTASSVDSMLKEKGYLDGTLYIRINKAVEDHLITSEMGKWAHHVRLDSNKERHAEHESELPTIEDARKSIDFAIALGEFLFVLPSRVSEGLK